MGQGFGVSHNGYTLFPEYCPRKSNYYPLLAENRDSQLRISRVVEPLCVRFAMKNSSKSPGFSQQIHGGDLRVLNRNYLDPKSGNASYKGPRIHFFPFFHNSM